MRKTTLFAALLSVFLFFGALALLGFIGLAMVKVRWRTTWGAVSGARV